MRDKRLIVFPACIIFMIWMMMQYHRINLRDIGDCQDPLIDDCLMGRGIENLAFITSYFQLQAEDLKQDATRQAEIDICLASAVGSIIFQTVHVLGTSQDLEAAPSFVNAYKNKYYEDNTGKSLPRVVTSEIQGRPMMADFFQYACDHLRDYRVVISNADIYYDSTLNYFFGLSDNAFDHRFFAISRWEIGEYGLTPNKYIGHGSYDTFVFRPRVLCGDYEDSNSDHHKRFNELKANLQYPLGVLGAENRLLYEIHRLYPKLLIMNPARTVRTVHLHNSKTRGENYWNFVNTDGRSYYVNDREAY